MRLFERRIIRLERASGLGQVHPHIVCVLADAESVKRAAEWWEAKGRGEVVGDRPEVFPARGPHGLYVDPDTMREITEEVTPHTLLIMQEGPTAEIMNADNIVVDGLPAPDEAAT